MTTFLGSPRILKGALIGVDIFNPLANIVVFQYNPDTMTRRLGGTCGGREKWKWKEMKRNEKGHFPYFPKRKRKCWLKWNYQMSSLPRICRKYTTPFPPVSFTPIPASTTIPKRSWRLLRFYMPWLNYWMKKVCSHSRTWIREIGTCRTTGKEVYRVRYRSHGKFYTYPKRWLLKIRRKAMIINLWTKKYMLRPAAHCRSGCMWNVISERWKVKRGNERVKYAEFES